MNIISRIKSWFEPKIEEPVIKPRIIFKSGIVQACIVDHNEIFEVELVVNKFCSLNRSAEQENIFLNDLRNRANAHIDYTGMANVGIVGQMRGNPQSLMGASIWGGN